MRISDWSSDVCSSDLPHGKAIRQDNAGMFRRIQHFEQHRLLAVVRASRVARRGADASIVFADQRFIRELLALRIAPKRGTDVLMPACGGSFLQTNRQSLHQTRNRRLLTYMKDQQNSD